MKWNKKTMVPLSIILGIALLASSAYAETVTSSAYDQMKDAIKSTSARMSQDSSNYSMQTDFTLTDSGTMIMRRTSGQRHDGDKQESRDTIENQLGLVQTNYTYSDRTQHIWYDSSSDTYYVNEYTNVSEKPMPEGGMYDGTYNPDPLAQEHVADLERILDAFVGNLRNYVTVTSLEDGSKVFSGTLSDTQIPALVNAVASFLTKQYLSSSSAMPGQPAVADAVYEEGMTIDTVVAEKPANQSVSLQGDIFIKYFSGTARTDPQGLLTAASFNIVLSGRDADGSLRELAFDVSMNLEDVGTTQLSAPDLTGQNVIINKVDNGYQRDDKLSAKFVGTYRNDIVVDQGDAFVKIGERTLVIESIDQDQVTGRYFETYLEGSDSEPLSFSFAADNVDPYGLSFTYTDDAGRTGSGSIYFDMSSSIQLHLDKNMGSWTTPFFARVFD